MIIPDQMPPNFCIAPFQSTRQNAYGRTSPCAFGAGEWRLGDLTPEQRWDSPELNLLRESFLRGERPAECHRCWAEEDAGKESLRQRQQQYFPNDYEDFIKSGQWKSGPKTAVFKTSNVCNLACRSCAGWDSNSYTAEGKYYLEAYNTRMLVNGEVKSTNRFIPVLQPKHVNFMDYVGIANNLEKIDFFGGEPLLNTSQLEFLEYLANKGLSKNITLFYSTNCTNKPTERLIKVWSKFKRLEIALSVDGVGDKFEYLRWPGQWSDANRIIDHILGLRHRLDCDFYTLGSLTISAMNCYYVDDIYQWHKDTLGDVYINMVTSPDYLAIHILPEEVKQSLRTKISHSETLGYLDITQPNELLFNEFIRWMKRQDLYRNQSFQSTFPEYYELFANKWDTIGVEE